MRRLASKIFFLKELLKFLGRQVEKQNKAKDQLLVVFTIARNLEPRQVYGKEVLGMWIDKNCGCEIQVDNNEDDSSSLG